MMYNPKAEELERELRTVKAELNSLPKRFVSGIWTNGDFQGGDRARQVSKDEMVYVDSYKAQSLIDRISRLEKQIQYEYQKVRDEEVRKQNDHDVRYHAAEEAYIAAKKRYLQKSFFSHMIYKLQGQPELRKINNKLWDQNMSYEQKQKYFDNLYGGRKK